MKSRLCNSRNNIPAQVTQTKTACAMNGSFHQIADNARTWISRELPEKKILYKYSIQKIRTEFVCQFPRVFQLFPLLCLLNSCLWAGLMEPKIREKKIISILHCCSWVWTFKWLATWKFQVVGIMVDSLRTLEMFWFLISWLLSLQVQCNNENFAMRSLAVT